MINRIFGVLFTLIAIGIIALAAYNFGNYESLFFGKDKAAEETIDEYVDEDYSTEVTDIVDEQEAVNSDATAVDSLAIEELPRIE